MTESDKRSEKKNIVVIANERVGLETARQMLEKKHEVSAIFTSHQSRKDKIADYADFAVLESQFPEVPIHYILNPKEPLVVDKIRSYAPWLIVVVSWSQILPKDLLDIPGAGTVGIHYSLLPERRGGAPLTWALIDGLEVTGLTLFYYDEGIDTGDMIDSVEIEIAFDDTISDLLDKVLTALPKLVLENLDGILECSAQRLKQDESQATYTRPRTPKDGEIDWSKSGADNYNFIRAQSAPYPNAFSKLIDKNGKSRKLVVTSASFENKSLLIEGKVEENE